jgi:hypothetical protein
LLDRIGVTVLDWTGYAGLNRRGQIGPDLRQLAAHTWPEMADGERLARILAGLASAATARLAGEITVREMRNHPCPQCGQGVFLRTDDLGENVRSWPLRTVFSEPDARGDRLVRYVECQACAAYWWRGDLPELGDALALTGAGTAA